MAFLLYGTKDDTTWIRIREFALGRLLSGFVQRYVEEDSERDGRLRVPPFEWQADEQALLRLEGLLVPSRYGPPRDGQPSLPLVPGYRTWLLAIDLKPDREGNVSLYRLQEVWGYSEKASTPICLRLEPLFVDLDVEDSVSFKHQFQLSPTAERGGPIYEFLYLNHPEGVRGPWTWGQVGNVNGALLWPKALGYFMERILARDGVSVDFRHIFALRGMPPGLVAKRKPRGRRQAGRRTPSPSRRD